MPQKTNTNTVPALNKHERQRLDHLMQRYLAGSIDHSPKAIVGLSISTTAQERVLLHIAARVAECDSFQNFARQALLEKVARVLPEEARSYLEKKIAEGLSSIV